MITTEERHRTKAAQIVGSLSDPVLQQMLRQDIADSLAQAEATGFEEAAEVFSEGSVRVLRVLEYVYPDARTAASDQLNWAIQGARRHGRTFIRSTVIPPEVLG